MSLIIDKFYVGSLDKSIIENVSTAYVIPSFESGIDKFLADSAVKYVMVGGEPYASVKGYILYNYRADPLTDQVSRLKLDRVGNRFIARTSYTGRLPAREDYVSVTLIDKKRKVTITRIYNDPIGSRYLSLQMNGETHVEEPGDDAVQDMIYSVYPEWDPASRKTVDWSKYRDDRGELKRLGPADPQAAFKRMRHNPDRINSTLKRLGIKDQTFFS